MGDKNSNWPKYDRISLLTHLHKIRNACNFVSTLNKQWNDPWYHHTVLHSKLSSVLWKPSSQNQTRAGGIWTLRHSPAPRSSSLLEIHRQRHAGATSRGGQEAPQFPPTVSAALIPKPRAGLLAAWPRLLFLSSQVRVILFEFPDMDMGILGTKILLRDMAKTSDCISSYLSHYSSVTQIARMSEFRVGHRTCETQLQTSCVLASFQLRASYFKKTS